ncbi:MAG: ketoacyl-ACP synthase III [Treponema sp.]|nr:ketoacyl-ACP synthase III [Treponema sp.]
MKAYIKAIEYYLPEKIITNADIARKFPEWTEEKIFEKVGIRERHICGENETALDMAFEACKKLFEKNKELKESIDYILLCTQSADYKLPTSACILQDRLGLRSNIGALDFNLGCSGYEYGLSLAKGLVVGGMAKNVLLVTAETYSKYIHPEDKGNISIFGDAATATIVSTDGFAEICDFVFGTDGTGCNNLIVRTGGSKYPKQLYEITKDENEHTVSSDHLYMDGGSVFSFTLKQVPKMVKDLLEKADLSMDNINLFVFHQANAYMLEFLRKKLKIENKKFYYCIENVGNTVSNTVPIALFNAIQDGSLVGKQNVLLAGFGVGLSWSGCILNFN